VAQPVEALAVVRLEVAHSRAEMLLSTRRLTRYSTVARTSARSFSAGSSTASRRAQVAALEVVVGDVLDQGREQVLLAGCQ
jgi:hypothetical protein